MRVLVLGGTGFIGGHIARAALDEGWEVRALRRDPDSEGLLSDTPVEWVEGDLESPDGLEPIFRDIDVVFHAAGYYPRDSRDVPSQVAHSVQQSEHVMELARAGRVKRLIYTSSFTSMVPSRIQEGRLVDERDQYPPDLFARSAYYECKVAMEGAFLTAGVEGPEVVILNPTTVLGPGGKTVSIGGILLAVARGWGVVWLPAKVNVVDVRDVALGSLQAALRGRAGERYLLGGHNLELRNLMEKIAELTGARKPVLKLPLELIDVLVWMEDHLPRVNVFANHMRTMRAWPDFSIEKASREISYAVRPLQETLVDVLKSYQARGYL
jgi:dihydroflavonol-4-reductase